MNSKKQNISGESHYLKLVSSYIDISTFQYMITSNLKVLLIFTDRAVALPKLSSFENMVICEIEELYKSDVPRNLFFDYALDMLVSTVVYYCGICNSYSQYRCNHAQIFSTFTRNRFDTLSVKPLSELCYSKQEQVSFHRVSKRLNGSITRRPVVVETPSLSSAIHNRVIIRRFGPRATKEVIQKYYKILKNFVLLRKKKQFQNNDNPSLMEFIIECNRLNNLMDSKATISHENKILNDVKADILRKFPRDTESLIQHEMDVQDEIHPSSGEVVSVPGGSSNIHVQPNLSTISLGTTDTTNYIVKENVALQNISDRWFHYFTVAWSTADAVDKELIYFDIPKHLLTTSEDTQNALRVIRNFAYTRFDIELLFQLSTTEFHSGCLVASVIYGGDESSAQFNSKNVYSYLNRPHVKLFAGAGCEGYLEIPYRYPFSMLPNLGISELDDNKFGFVSLRVLNPLQWGSSNVSTVYITISFKLKNVELSGIRTIKSIPKSYDVIDHEMEEASNLLGTGINLLKILTDLDKPRSSTKKIGFVPQTMQNPSVSSGCDEVTNVLSIEDTIVTPHMEDLSDCEINTFIRSFGFFRTLQWNVNDAASHLLMCVPAAPLMPKRFYKKISDATESNLATYLIPPIGVISSTAGYFRGSLEFKFDVVATKFHAGRIIISYIPGPRIKDYSPTTAELMSCPFVIYDIAKEKQFVFQVPYISHQLMYPRLGSVFRHKAEDIIAPGFLYVAVLNPLAINSSTIANNVNINVYMRGGEDFELYIPAQPSLIVGYHADIPIDTLSFIRALPGYSPWYYGNWHLTPGFLVLRYGSVSDHIAQFTSIVRGGIYMTAQPVPSLTFYILQKDKSKKKVVLTHTEIIYIALYDANGYNYLIPFPSNYQDYFVKYMKDNDVYKKWGDFKNMSTFVRGFCSTYGLTFDENLSTCTGNPRLDLVWEYSDKRKMSITTLDDMEYEIDERFELACKIDNPMSISKPLKNVHIGEQPLTLLNLLRRYQLYTHLNCKLMSHDLFSAVIELPIQVECFLSKDQYFWKTCKDNVISLLSSCYWFFKGSLRFKILCHQPNVTFWVQHKFDSRIPSDKVRYINQATSVMDMFNHGYGFIMQNSSINPCIEIETPYYAPSDVLVNQSREEYLNSSYQSQYGNLGSLILGCSADCDFTILYAFGDAARYSLFIGPPPMSFLSDMPLEHENGYLSGVTTSAKKYLDFCTDQVSSVKSGVAGYIKVGETLNNFCDKLPDFKDQMVDSITRLGSLFKECIAAPLYNNIKHIIIVITSNLAHLLHNPTKVGCFILIGAIFSSIAYFSAEYVVNLVNVIKAIFSDYSSDSSPSSEQISDGDCDPDIIEHEIYTSDLSGKIDQHFPALITAIFFLLGAKLEFDSSPWRTKSQNWKILLTEGLPRRAHYANTMLTFVSNMWKMIKDIVQYIVSIRNPEYEAYNFFSEKEQVILEWAAEVERLSRPEQWETIKANKHLISRVKISMDFGSVILSKLVLLKNECDPIFFSRCRLFYDKISKLHQKCCDSALYSNSAGEPFCLWMAGPTGIGKSSFKDYIISYLITNSQIFYEGDMIYSVPGMPKYWTGCARQPCVYFDDFLFNANEAVATDLITSFVNLKTNAPFNPPMAELADKHIIYSPKLMYVNSNYAYPIPPGVAHLEAFYRRRDCLVSCRIRPEYLRFYVAGSLQVFNMLADPNIINAKKIIDDALYVQFGIHRHPHDRDHGNDIHWYDNNDEFLHEVLYRFRIHQQLQVAQEMKRIKLVTNQHNIGNFYNLHDCVRDGRIYDQDYNNQPSDLFKDADKMKKHIELDHFVDHEIDDDDLDTNMFSIPQHEIDDHGNLSDAFRERVMRKTNLNAAQAAEEAMNETVYHMNVRKYFPEGICDYSYSFQQLFVDNCPIQYRSFKIANNPLYCYHQDLNFLTDYAIVCGNTNPFGRKNVIFRAGYKYDIKFSKSGSMYYNVKFGDLVFYPMSLTDPCAYNKCPFQNRAIREQIVQSWHNALPEDLSLFSENPYVVPADADLIVKFRFYLNSYVLKGKDFMQKIKSKMSSVISWLIDNIDVILQVLYLVICFLLVVFKTYVSYRNYRDTLGSKDHEIFYSADPKIMRVAKSKTGIKVKSKCSHESAIPNMNNLVSNIKRNTAFFVLFAGDNKPVVARVFFYSGTYCIMLKHQYEIISGIIKSTEHSQLLLSTTTGFKKKIINFLDLEYTDYKDSSIGILNVIGIPPFRNYLTQFATEKQHQNLGSLGILAETLMDDFDNVDVRQWPSKISTGSRVIAEKKHANYVMSEVTLDVCYEYSVHGKGMCGSILIMNNMIVGIHVGGGNMVGISEPLIREMFVDTTTNVLNDRIVPNLEEVGVYNLDCAIVPLGYVLPEHSHHESGVSQYKESELYELFGPSVMEPSILSVDDPRNITGLDPMIVGCKFHGDLTYDFPKKLLDIAGKDLLQLYCAKLKPMRSTVSKLSINESVCGIPGLDGYESMKMNTSEGYPYSSRRPFGVSDKSWMFKFENHDDGTRSLVDMDEQLKNIMHLKHQMRIRKVTPFTLFVDCLKDCKLPKDKIIKLGSTRVFSISPVDFTIQMRQYFLDFSASYQNNHFDVGSGIGISKNKMDWTLLVNLIVGNSSKIIAGDYSKFGPRLNACCVMKAFEIINNWYKYYGASTEDCLVREIMAEEIGYAKHLMYDFVYQVACGAPSGSALTVIINDIVNQLYLRIAWLSITNTSLHEFYQNVKLCTYGDDLLMSVKDSFIDKYNVNTLHLFFSRYNIKFTDANKGEDGSYLDYITLDKATFLKSGFVPHPFRPGVWLSPLQLDCALEAAYWFHNKDDPLNASIVNGEACLLELFGHGPDIYTKYKDMIEDRLISLGVHHVYRSWNELDALFFD